MWDLRTTHIGYILHWIILHVLILFVSPPKKEINSCKIAILLTVHTCPVKQFNSLRKKINYLPDEDLRTEMWLLGTNCHMQYPWITFMSLWFVYLLHNGGAHRNWIRNDNSEINCSQYRSCFGPGGILHSERQNTTNKNLTLHVTGHFSWHVFTLSRLVLYCHDNSEGSLFLWRWLMLSTNPRLRVLKMTTVLMGD